MIKQITSVMMTIFFAANVFAYGAEDMHPTYQWIDTPTTSNGVHTSLGLGILNSDYFTGAGTSMFFDASTDYAVTENFGMGLNIPFAGIVSDNLDGFGLGNIALNAKYFFDTDSNLIAGVASEFAFATATSDATVGTTTRKFYRYGQDQWAVVPSAVLGFEKESLQVIGRVGLPIQLFNDDGQIEGDTMETSLSYDLGTSVAVNDTRDLWITVEAGGYSTLSLDTTDEQTELFGSLGAQYQNDEMAFGLTATVPFTEDVRNAHNVLFYGNFAYRFQ